MGWLGAGGNGAAGIGFYIGFGGILMNLGAIGEWILGNTFPCVVFGSFGGFWIAYAMTLMPYTGAISNYAPISAQTNPHLAFQSLGFLNSFGMSFLHE